MAATGEQRTLTPKQEQFCQLYTQYWEATRAAREAGYSDRSASSMGYQLLQNPIVQKRIEELKEHALKEIGVSRERILLEAARIAFFDPKNAFDEFGQPKPFKELDENTRRCVVSIETFEVLNGKGDDREVTGLVKNVKFVNKKVGFDVLLAGTDLGIKRHEHSGPQGKPISVNALSDEELDAKISALLGKSNGKEEG